MVPLSTIVGLIDPQGVMRNIRVSVICPSDCNARIHLLCFESLIYLILCQLYECVEEGSHLEIRVLDNSADIVLVFSSDGLGELQQELFFNDAKSLFIRQMKASLSWESRSLVLNLPVEIQAVKSR